jgi:hypothetical protein
VVYITILDHILSNGRLAEEWLNGGDFEGNYLENIDSIFRSLLEELQEITKENLLRMDQEPVEIRNRHLSNTGLGNKAPYSLGTR